MKTLFEHIDYVKSKPHHVREKVVFATAGGITAVIALTWLVGSLSLGLFAIKGSNFAEATQPQDTVMVVSDTGSPALAGAAAALDAKAPAHIEIVDTTPKASTTKKAEPTVIPF